MHAAVCKWKGCVYDGKRYLMGASIPRHLQIHTGYRPFRCDLCGKMFLTNFDMSRHKRTHKEVNKSKGDSSMNRGVLTNYCLWEMNNGEMCQKTFIDPKNLYEHVCNEHVQRVVCAWEDCVRRGKQLESSESLASHMCRHTRFYPLKCDVCGKTFSRRYRFEKHRKNHKEVTTSS